MANFDNVIANAELVRTVAFGIKITTRANPQTVSGVVHVCPIPDDLTSPSWTFPSTPSALYAMPGYTRIPLANLSSDYILAPGRWADYSAFRYMDPGYIITSSTTQLQSSGWSNIAVFVESTASIPNIVDVDIIHHWEFQPKMSVSAGIIEPTDAADYSPSLMGAVKYVVARMPSVAVKAATALGRISPQVGLLLEAGIQVVNGLSHTESNVTWKQPKSIQYPNRKMLTR